LGRTGAGVNEKSSRRITSTGPTDILVQRRKFTFIRSGSFDAVIDQELCYFNISGQDGAVGMGPSFGSVISIEAPTSMNCLTAVALQRSTAGKNGLSYFVRRSFARRYMYLVHD
jgi:hypothetical protein